MLFFKDIFGDIPKALSVKEIKAIPDNYNFLETGILPYRRLVLFLSPLALRLPPYEFSPCKNLTIRLKWSYVPTGFFEKFRFL